jgi:peroxiredoxin
MLSFLLITALSLAAPRPLTVGPGETALVFGLPAINEALAVKVVNKTQVSLGDFTGVMPSQPRRAVVVHFFKRRRGGEVLAALNKIQKRFGSKGVQVLAITADQGDPARMTEWVEAQRLGFPVLRDNHQVVTSRYGITEFPITVVIDGQGRIFAIGQPLGEEAESAIEAEIEPLIR